MKLADAVWSADSWSLVIISDEYVFIGLVHFFTQIWFGFKSWSLGLSVGAFILQIMKSDIFIQILLWISSQSLFFFFPRLYI